MTKANLQIDFGNLGPDELANALALVAAALRGAFVPRNSVTGAIEITEGPDAVQPTATLGSPDAFWSAAFIDSLNIGGREITADTLLPVTPLIFTRPVDATEDQTPSIIWPWPHSQETAARIRVVSPQTGGQGGSGGAWIGPNTQSGEHFRNPDSSTNNPDILGFFTHFEFYVYGLSFGDQFLFSFGRGGLGGAGGPADTRVYGSAVRGPVQSGSNGRAPVGFTAIRVPSRLPRWRVAGVRFDPVIRDPQSGDFEFKGGLALYDSPGSNSPGVLLSGNETSPALLPNLGGRQGAAGRYFSSNTPPAQPGSPGGNGSNGFIIIEPFRGTT